MHPCVLMSPPRPHLTLLADAPAAFAALPTAPSSTPAPAAAPPPEQAQQQQPPAIPQPQVPGTPVASDRLGSVTNATTVLDVQLRLVGGALNPFTTSVSKRADKAIKNQWDTEKHGVDHVTLVTMLPGPGVTVVGAAPAPAPTAARRLLQQAPLEALAPSGGLPPPTVLSHYLVEVLQGRALEAAEYINRTIAKGELADSFSQQGGWVVGGAGGRAGLACLVCRAQARTHARRQQQQEQGGASAAANPCRSRAPPLPQAWTA